MSYDVDVLPLGPGDDFDAAFEALMDADDAGVSPGPADPGTVAALKARGFDVVRTGDGGAVDLDDGGVAIALNGAEARLEVSAGAERAAVRLFEVIGILRDLCGWRAFDPQLGREITEADRGAVAEQLGES